MVPASYVRLDQWPLTPNGKIDRGALPAPGDERLAVGTPAVPPTNEIERAIANLWKELLQVKSVDIHDNFFDLGGHSLLLIQAHRRLLEMFPTDLSIVQMLEHPTVAALARYLRDGDTHPEGGPAERLRDGKRRMRQRRGIREQSSMVGS
jgi:hypothetical protein